MPASFPSDGSHEHAYNKRERSQNLRNTKRIYTLSSVFIRRSIADAKQNVKVISSIAKLTMPYKKEKTQSAFSEQRQMHCNRPVRRGAIEVDWLAPRDCA
jgi:hypothetical protein